MDLVTTAAAAKARYDECAGHTPGPWEFRVYASGCTIVSKHDAPGRSVRDWLKGVSITVDAQIGDDQGNAHEASPDARLIVAAPDLLEALSEAIDALDASRGIGAYPDFEAWEAKARAAIAKATGTSSEDRSLHGEGGRS